MNIIVWGTAIISSVVLYSWYATIVTRRNRVAEALAGIDVQLAQRHDLIPNLLAIARKYMDHERGLLEEITSLRSKAASFTGTTDPAAAVRKALVERYNIEDTRLSTNGFGASQPKESNDSDRGRALNRRVELVRP
jgi:hypothetical protein